ncbi:AI-2E family transporter [Clostridium grantii]|uniref:Predicted PurR-regulated permease PerM n=1 Tax=Clostridium grantii DSM 8605 TaxID=1121316 RepID=A0A1M5UKY8_9CLOT|nr:AI-2E family transporter [Clostridium grantii]SHH63722.1 Predicted PurR-regulated permease PerM [Clostridium grantii DSM 8605]
MKFNNKFYNYGLGVLLILVILFMMSKITFIIEPLMVILNTLFIPFLFGGFIYYLFRPLMIFLQKRGVKRNLAAGITFVVFIGLIVWIVGYSGNSVTDTFSESYEELTLKIDNLQGSFYKNLQLLNIDEETIKNLNDSVIPYLQSSAKNISKSSLNFLSNVASVSTIIILVPIVAFYLLKDGEKFKQNIIDMIPSKKRNYFVKLIKEIDTTLYTYISGQMFVAFFIGLLMFIGYTILGMQNALALGIFAMITSVIPFLGPFLGILPALLIALMTDIKLLLWIIVLSIIVQQIEGKFVTPNILGNKLNIHPLTVIFMIFIFVSLFGVIGAFIAIPTYSIIKVIIKSLYDEFRNKNNE